MIKIYEIFINIIDYSMFSPLSDIPYFLKTSEHKNIINR